MFIPIPMIIPHLIALILPRFLQFNHLIAPHTPHLEHLNTPLDDPRIAIQIRNTLVPVEVMVEFAEGFELGGRELEGGVERERVGPEPEFAVGFDGLHYCALSRSEGVELHRGGRVGDMESESTRPEKAKAGQRHETVYTGVRNTW